MVQRALGAVAIGATVLGLQACTATQFAHMTKYGSAARVTCVTGEAKVWFDDESTGAVSQHEGGDVSFVSATTSRLVQVSGACTIDYGAHLPASGAVRPGDKQAI